MKKAFLFCVAILISLGIRASSITVSGAVGGNWSTDTVNVAGDLIVNADTVLTIAAGTKVIFLGHYEIWVRGVIRAEGTEEAPILFTVSDTTGFSDTLSTAGGWHGFLYNQSPWPVDTSVFVFCYFDHGKAVSQDTTGVYGGVFRIFNWNKVVLRHCSFNDNLAYKWGGAIYLKYANIVLDSNEFRRNRCGKATFPWGYGGALCVVSSSPVVTHCVFEENTSTGIGGGASFEYSDPDLRFNIFTSNMSGLGGGFGYLRSYPERIASNNLVEGNSAVFFGGGVSCIRSNTVFANNTITDNYAVYGGGFYANDSAFPVHYNSLFYDNRAEVGQEVYIWDIKSAPDFYFCNMPGGKEGFEGSGGQQGYHGIFEHNLDTMPGFASPGSYLLSFDSPMVDAGDPDTSGMQVPHSDLAGNSRYIDERIDIGAYEWNPSPGFQESAGPSDDIRIVPHPVKDHFTLHFNCDYARSVQLSILTLSGQTIWSSEHVCLVKGPQEIRLGEDIVSRYLLRPGSYLLRLGMENDFRYEIFIKQ